MSTPERRQPRLGAVEHQLPPRRHRSVGPLGGDQARGRPARRIETACSRFRVDSELMTLARDPDGSAELSPLLAELMADALDAARETGGAVDPTLGRCWSGWATTATSPRCDVARPGPVAARPSWWYADPPAGAASRSTAGDSRCQPGCSSTWAPPRRRVRPTAAPGWSPTGSAPACWSASVATSPPPDRRRATAGRSSCRTCPTTYPSRSPSRPAPPWPPRATLRRTWAAGRTSAPPPRGPAHRLPAAPSLAQRHRGRADAAAGQHRHRLPRWSRARSPRLAAVHRPARPPGHPAAPLVRDGQLAAGRPRHERGALGPGPRHRRRRAGGVHAEHRPRHPQPGRAGRSADWAGSVSTRCTAPPPSPASAWSPSTSAASSSTPTPSSSSSTSWCPSSAATGPSGSGWDGRGRPARGHHGGQPAAAPGRAAGVPAGALADLRALADRAAARARHRDRCRLAVDGRRRRALHRAVGRAVGWRLLPSYAERGPGPDPRVVAR